MEFRGRVALITGAAQGIGFECGRILCAGGADVILVDVNEAGLLAAQKELEGLGKPVAIYTCNVADEEAVNQVIASVMERYAKVDILINNAGIFRADRGPFAQSESAHWRKKIDINIYGTLYFTRGVINSMLEQNYGRIINIASVAGTYGLANMVDYSLTKGAILAFSKALAREVTGSGVLVNTVSPGNINPDPNFTPKSSYMNRSGHPRECAEAICFLASDKASFISGCDYVVDGCRRKLYAVIMHWEAAQMIHSFLLIGQSNMAGRGFLHEVEPISNKRLKVLRNGRWYPMYAPVNCDRPFSGVNLAESFADMYAKEHDVEVGLIPCADGGTRIDQWRVGGLLYDHAIYQARLASRTSTIAGVLWHQGESDCTPERYPYYAEKLQVVMDSFRKDLELYDVPFLLGGLGEYLPLYADHLTNYVHINAALENYAKDNPMTGFVSAKGLKPNPDNLHFCAASLREFGLRYYREFQTLEDKNKVFVEKGDEFAAARTKMEFL